MIEYARMNGRMDWKVSRNLMTEFVVEEDGEEGKDMLIVRVSKDEQWVERQWGGNDR